MGACILFAAVAMTIAGCGGRNQAGTDAAGGAVTPAQVRQNAAKQQQDMQNHANSGAQNPSGTP